MFNSIISFFQVPSDTPLLNRARYRALATQIPIMYGMVIVNMFALSYTLIGSGPDYLTVWVPGILAPIAIYRSIAILKCDIDALSDIEIRSRLIGVVKFSILLAPLFLSWSLSLFKYGDPYSQGQIAFFICLTSIGCIHCLSHLRQASLIIGVTALITTSGYFSFADIPAFSAIAINMVLVISAMIFIMLRTSQNFTELITKQRMLSDQSDRLEVLNAENMRLANLDSLTKLPNRRSFFSELEELTEKYRGTQKQFVVGILDLDGFKMVNDLFGHPTGDQLLVEVGKRLRAKLNNSITLARLGGDEFGLIIRNASSDEALLQLGRDLCGVLQVPFSLREGTANIAATLGFASYPSAGETAEILFERADYALCYSKQNTKGNVVLFSSEHETIIREVSSIAHNLQEADLDKELSVVYQPIIDTLTGKTTAFEALARWNNPVLGNIQPDVFIRSAEQSGMISQLTVILFAKALKAASAWPDNVKLSFNLSAFDVCSHEHMIRLISMMEQSGISASRLIFEITETAVMQDFERANENLTLIRNAGASIALDDFGTGFSSLSYVQRMQVDRLKIDRSFIQKVGTDKATRDIVRSVADLCRNLNLQCVVEGVETKAQLNALDEMGCNLIQGYYFSRPLIEADALEFLSKENIPETALAINS